MPYQEGSPGSIICAYLWGFSPRLGQVCMRADASYYGSREVLAGPRKRLFYFLNVCALLVVVVHLNSLFPRLPGNAYVGKSRAYGHSYFLRLKSTQAGTLLLRQHQWLDFYHEI